MATPLQELQTWYRQQCNGDWEHQYGIRVETLDNPGWEVVVDLVGTALFSQSFEEIATERTETDWIRCRVSSGRYEGFGGPGNLEELLQVFLGWASAGKPPL